MWMLSSPTSENIRKKIGTKWKLLVVLPSWARCANTYFQSEAWLNFILLEALSLGHQVYQWLSAQPHLSINFSFSGNHTLPRPPRRSLGPFPWRPHCAVECGPIAVWCGGMSFSTSAAAASDYAFWEWRKSSHHGHGPARISKHVVPNL